MNDARIDQLESLKELGLDNISPENFVFFCTSMQDMRKQKNLSDREKALVKWYFNPELED